MRSRSTTSPICTSSHSVCASDSLSRVRRNCTFKNLRCDHCAALEEDDVLNRIVYRAGEEDLHLSPINNQYLTATQAQRRYAAYLARNGALRLALLASNRRLAIVNSQLELSKRIFVLLSQNQIPRLHQLLAHQLKRGATPAKIAKQIELAIKGGYVASGNKTEDELDQVCD